MLHALDEICCDVIWNAFNINIYYLSGFNISTIDKEELKFKPGLGQNDRSNKHIGNQDFDKEIGKKYLAHIDINNLKGLEVSYIYKWKIGESMIMDRTHIHSSSSNIKDRKLGLTTFTKK